MEVFIIVDFTVDLVLDNLVLVRFDDFVCNSYVAVSILSA